MNKYYVTLCFETTEELENVLGDIKELSKLVNLQGIEIYPFSDEQQSLAEEQDNGREEESK